VLVRFPQTPTHISISVAPPSERFSSIKPVFDQGLNLVAILGTSQMTMSPTKTIIASTIVLLDESVYK